MGDLGSVQRLMSLRAGKYLCVGPQGLKDGACRYIV